MKSNGKGFVVEVSCLSGRFVIEKIYQDTYFDKKNMEEFIGQFKTFQDVLSYLKIDKEQINMNLESLVKEIKKNKKYADEVIEGGNPATYTIRMGRKLSAKGRLEELYTQYRLDVRPNLVFIIPIGSEAQNFIDLASQNNMVVARADDFYEDLAKRIPGVFYNGKQSMRELVDVLSRHLEDKAVEVGVRSYPAIVYQSKYSKKIKGKEELLKFVKKVINEDVGPEMVAAQLLDAAARSAMEIDFCKGKLPVIVSLTDLEILDNIVSGLKSVCPNVVLIGAGRVGKNQRSGVLACASKLDQDSFLTLMDDIKNSLTNNNGKRKK